MQQRKAVVLLSGGLDSMLAAKVIMEQGIHVEALNFYTGFCIEGHTHAIRSKDQKKPKRNNALWAAEQLGIKLHFVDIVEEYKKVVINPKHGYGANLNPCLDCKIFMVGDARKWMEKQGFDFIITGEVIGQRPNSQLKHKLPIVAKQSGAAERLLRPLSAKHLPPTLPEIEGWVDREQLFDFTGRSRKPQMALAKKFGFHEYAQPAGGCCILTNEHYTKKMQDLWQARGTRNYELEDVVLLKVGRHLRPKPHFKLIIGREEGENNFLEGFKSRYSYLHAANYEGSTVLVDGELKDADLPLAAQIAARYSAGRDAATVDVHIKQKQETAQTLTVQPLSPDAIQQEWYV